MKKLTLTLEYEPQEGTTDYDTLSDALRAVAHHIEDYQQYAGRAEGFVNYVLTSGSTESL